MEGCGAEGKILMEYFMQKFIFEHLIEDREEKIFDSEKDAIKYALTMHSNYTGDMVVVEVDVSENSWLIINLVFQFHALLIARKCGQIKLEGA